jgi:predicted DNA-binding transcriptional regulator YafY
VPHSASRVLAMLELLQAHHRLKGVELADRLGVDERTVRRYATQLAELGIPVEASRGRYGGYQLRPGYKLPPLMFTDDEATAVVLGLLAGRVVGLGTTSSGPATETALAKVQRVLPRQLAERIAAVQDTLGLTIHPRDAVAPETTTVLSLAAAAHQHRRVHLEYGSWRGERTERDLDPYGLVAHGGRWYVTGFDHRREQVRTFRLDRITSLRLTGESFTPPDDFDPVSHVVTSLANVPYAHEVEVTLRTSLKEASRRIPRSAARLTETADGVLLRARAERLDGMAQLLAGLGWPFVIHRPAALRQEVQRLAVSLRAYAELPTTDA